MTTENQFRTDGGATWLNLLATRGQSFGARPVERLSDTSAAGDWLTLAGLPPVTPVDDGDLARLIGLREALRDLAMAAVEGRDAGAGARRIVEEHASRPATGLTAEATPVHPDAALSAIALGALLTLRGPERDFLKECAELDCRWVFLDLTGRRRWCPAPACASRGRVRAHRAALHAAPHQPSASGRREPVSPGVAPLQQVDTRR